HLALADQAARGDREAEVREQHAGERGEEEDAVAERRVEPETLPDVDRTRQPRRGVPRARGDEAGREPARDLRHVRADPGGGERVAPVEQELHARPPALDVAPEVLRDDEDGERLAALQEVARLVVARDRARRAEVAR